MTPAERRASAADRSRMGTPKQDGVRRVAARVGRRRTMDSKQAVYCEALVAHYSTSWGARRESHRWSNGPVSDLGSHFAIAQYDAANDAFAFATVGMSLVAEPNPIELHVFVQRDPLLFRSLVELLTIVSHFHRTGARLGLHDTVNFGRPWPPASSCTYGFISLPYLDGQKLERSSAVRARCLWLIPITEAEVALKRAHGVEALEGAFERTEFNYLDPNRESVV